MRLRTLVAVCVLAVSSAAFSFADEWNHRTVITFNKAVAIPAVHVAGMDVLPPGTYVFKLLDSLSDRHIVQIFNKEETEVYATILAIPNERLKATGDVVITFRETPAGQPLALYAMFYPGSLIGEEFVYPKTKAVEIAKAVAEPVLSMPEVEEPAPAPAAPEAIAELKEAPVAAVAPTGEELELAEVVTPPTVGMALPKTASPLPLIGLVGLLALGAGLTLRFAETRIR